MITSADGTEIAVFESGADGPSLVLVHGTTADHTRWAPVLDGLSAMAHVYAVDRRGRGASGDGPEYSWEREAEDIAAVVDAVPRPVVLLGHSFGGARSLDAVATAGCRPDALAVYEPALAVNGPFAEDGIRALNALAAAGDDEKLLVEFFTKMAGVSEAELPVMMAAPSWAARVKAAHTIPREYDAVNTRGFDAAALGAAVTMPFTVMKGTEGSPELMAAADAVHAAVPGSRLVVFEGHGHAVMDTGPDLFLAAVGKVLAAL